MSVAANISKPHAAMAVALLVLAAAVPYLPFLTLPPISDDYLQLGYSRNYVSREHWPEFASDALYRCRATSLVLTYWLDQLFGDGALPHRAASIAVHVLNVLLVACLGRWSRIGWRISLPAAFFFALREGHQEAVVWNAAIHDLLVFFFGNLTLLAWVGWLRTRTLPRMAAVLLLFILALLSKESAVVLPPLMLALWWLEGRPPRTPAWIIAAAFAVAGVYAWASFQASATHLHLNDGTFSWNAPVVRTVLFSGWRLLLPWGIAACLVVLPRRTGFACGALAFSIVALLPYSFLTYTDRVPSRHTYWAGLGVSLLIAAAALTLWDSRKAWLRPAAIILACAFAVHNTAYLWTRKLPQYRIRAEATEEFLRFAAKTGPPVAIGCAPYRLEVFEFAAALKLNWPRGSVTPYDKASPSAADRVFCYTENR